MEFVVLILGWAIPIVLIGYLVRVVQTIILGMRSMNSQLESRRRLRSWPSPNDDALRRT